MEMFAGDETTDDEMEHDLQQAMVTDTDEGQNREEDEKKYKC